MRSFKSISILLVAFMFLIVPVVTNAQNPWHGFFKPVRAVIPEVVMSDKALVSPSVWLFRPTVEVSAVQFVWDKTLKQFSSSSFTSAGLGIGYQHFIEVDGLPYNNFGFNAILLFDAIPTETTNTAISIAGTVSALKFINVGGGYNFTLKTPFILTGITYSFN